MRVYPLTYSQKNIWYTEKVYSGTSFANVAGTIRFKEKMNPILLERAINILVKNNEAMRTRIFEENGEVKQGYVAYEPFTVEIKDFSTEDDTSLYNWEIEQTRIPLKIINVPLFKFYILKISEDEFGCYLKIHHLISDAWSMTLIANNIVDNYLNLFTQKNIEEIKPSYVEYINNYDEYKKSEKFNKDREYWINKYDIAPEVTVLKPRTPKDYSMVSNRKTFVLPEKLCKKIYEYSVQNKVSVFALYMTALSMYMYRVTGKERLNLGTMLLNRSNKIEKNTIGMFVETLPIALDINGSANFDNLTKSITLDMLGVMRHHKYPFELIQEELRKRYNFDDVLYDIVLSYQNAKFVDKNETFDFKTRWHFAGYQSNALTVHINDRESESKLIIDYDYITDLFYDKEIDFLHDHIIRLLWHALDNPIKELNELEMVSETEKHKILYDFNKTETKYPNNKVVHGIIEETAKRLKDKVAVISNGESITYGELNRRANMVANKLRESGIKPNDMVGLLINRSLDMMVGLLGIMKSGAAYLPIDPEYPKERIKYMLIDSNAKFLITEEKLNDIVSNFDVSKFYIEKDFVSGNEENPMIINNPEDLVYVIYTSGSTGNPKGVMLKHKNINNFIKGTTDVIDFNENKTIVSVTTICFDIFVLESWLSLQKGLTIVLASEEEQTSPRLFNELCLKHNVNMLQTTPSRTDLLTNNLKFIEYVKNITDFMVGGEPFPKSLLENLKKISNANIYNMYGPTETAVWSSIKNMTNERKINIGVPMANTQFYILDKTLNLCPIGMIGDLYIGGEGLAKGYWGREELTEEKFIKNPYKENDLIYNTGDLARWMGNGEVCHMGRSDFQVKIRGYRIELGDIQKNLIDINGIENAVVKAIDNKYLIAYLICNENISVTELKSKLSKKLPQYMIPSYFVRMNEFVYTPNGKIDVKKLPELSEVEIMSEEFVEPETLIQKELAEVWSNLLNIKRISIKDDFFDIGGDSLSAINLSNELSEKYNIALAVKEIYDNSTIEKMANYLSTLEANNDNISIDKSMILLKKSNSKENIFFIHAGSGHATAYLEIAKGIDTFSCYGIEFNGLKDNVPYNTTIEELAQKYISYIKQVQSKPPYYIVGWCIGGTIAFEIARQLESQGEEVRFLMLLNSIAPQKNVEDYNITLENEKKFLFNNMPNIFEKIKDKESVKDIWNFMENNVNLINTDNLKKNITSNMSRGIPNYEKLDILELLYYINVLRVLQNARANYFPSNKVNTDINFVKAMLGDVVDNHNKNDELWLKYLKGNAEYFEFNVDHFSLTTQPVAKDIAKIINSILKES